MGNNIGCEHTGLGVMWVHIVMSAFGSRGDARRFLLLAAELRRRGHDVVLCGFADLEPAAGASAVPFAACGPDAVSGLAARADLVLATGAGYAWREAAREAGVPVRYVAFTPTTFCEPGRWPWSRPRISLEGLGFGPRPVLAADDVLAPLPAELRGRVVQVPAIVPPDGALPAEVEAFLAAGEPPAYVGFGSAPVPYPDRTTRDLLGAVRGLGIRAIVAPGAAGIGRTGVRDVLVADELPHASLFPRCAVVVHAGGPGTTAAACRAGVPQVVVPQVADQHFWAARVASLGLGKLIPGPHLTAAALTDRLRRLLHDQKTAFRAEVMAERLRSRDGAAEAADAVLA